MAASTGTTSRNRKWSAPLNLRLASAAVVAVAGLVGSGCGVGYNHVLFFTKSNVGIDIDTKPPTAEISVARREGAIAPTFEDGKTPPVAASFRVGVKGLIGLFADVSSTFAGGDAATTMTGLFDDAYTRKPKSDDPIKSDLCLSKAPDPIHVMGIPLLAIELPKAGEVRPFLFGTDTSLGLKVAWSGLTAQYPDSVKFGYNRKEFAWAPVFLGKGDCSIAMVKVPSFLATIDSSATAGSPQESGLKSLQYFATGDAATNLALRAEIRQTMLRRLDPAAAARTEVKQEIGALRERATDAKTKAHGLIDGLAESKLEEARNLLLTTGLRTADDAAFPAAAAERRDYLKKRAVAGDKREHVEALERYAAELEKLHQRGG